MTACLAKGLDIMMEIAGGSGLHLHIRTIQACSMLDEAQSST